MKDILSLLVVLLLVTFGYGKPPQAPRPQQAPSLHVPLCGNVACDCGCRETGTCDCLRAKGAVVVTDELSKSYAADWIAQGWTWHPELGYWTKPAPTTTPTTYQPYLSQEAYTPSAPSFRSYSQPSYTPSFQGFGGGGGFRSSGGGSRGGC